MSEALKHNKVAINLFYLFLLFKYDIFARHWQNLTYVSIKLDMKVLDILAKHWNIIL